MVALDLVLFFLVALILCCWVGYTPARLLLCGKLAEFRSVLLPTLGLATIIILSSWLNSTLLPMRAATPVILAMAAVANIALVLKTRRLEVKVQRRDAALAGLMAMAYGLGIAPLVHAGTKAFVGMQWDLEIYLPLTEYLKQYAVTAAVPAPPSPLLAEINGPAVRGGSGWGFSYFDAFMGALLGWRSFESFRPSLQFVFSLSIPAIFVFCHGALRMGLGASLAAAGLAGLNGLNLWIASMGLAGHTVALVMLPLALSAARWLTLFGDVRTSVLAGALLAAMLLSFYTGSLVVYAPASAALVAVCWWTASQRKQLILAVAFTGIVVGALALVGHLRFLDLLPLYAQLGFSGGWKVQEFSPLGEALGLIPYRLVADRFDGEPYWGLIDFESASGWAAFLAVGAALLCLAALRWRGWDRTMFLSCLLAWALFGLYLRQVAGYPYGFFKLLSLTGFLLTAGMVQGFVSVWRPPLLPVRVLRGLRTTAIACAALFALALATNTALSLRYFWEPDPHELPRSVWEMEALSDVLPPGARVYFPATEGQHKGVAAMVAYFLLPNPLVGHLQSQYGRLPAARPDAEFDYLALASDRRAWEIGLSPEDAVWRNELLALYRRPEGWLTSVDLAGTSDGIRLESGEELTISLGHGEWSITNGRERLRGPYRRGARDQEADLLLATFGEAAVRLQSGSEEAIHRLPQGFVGFRTPSLSTPASIQVAPSDGRTAWLVGMRVADGRRTASPGRGEPEATSPPAGLRQANDLLLLQPRADISGRTADLTLDYLFHESLGGYATAAVELYPSKGGLRGLPAAAFWRLGDLRGRSGSSIQLTLDFAGNRCNGRPLPFPISPGEYEAHLAIYYVSQEVLRWPWFRVVVTSTGAEVHPLSHPPYGIVHLDPPREVQSLRDALPVGEPVYAPRGPHPDYSFIPVAAKALEERTLVGGGMVRRALLPTGERPEAHGLREAVRVWSNGEAVLYQTAQSQPGPRALGGELLLQGLVKVTGGQATVTLPQLPPSEADTIIGVDIYGERPCGLDHFGYWAVREAQLVGEGEVVLELGRQTGKVHGCPGEDACPAFSQTWAVTDGRFRAFLFTKNGDRFETAPLFDFALQDGEITEVTPFPLVRLKL